MLNVIEGDLLKIEDGIIVHQVNCRGRMGSGLAGQLKAKYPSIYVNYIARYNEFINSGETTKLLGTIQLVNITTKLKIGNAFTQFNYGYDGKLYTNYDAIEEAFTKLKIVNIKKIPVYIPYKYGSALGGGDWKTVENIISNTYPEVTVVKRIGD